MLKKRTILGILCISLSLVICFVLTPLLNASANAKTSIVRVIRPVSKGDCITKSDITSVDIGKYNLPREVIVDENQVIGKYASADLLPGDYILKGKISNEESQTNGYLYNLDGSKQAISVTLKDFADGLSGKLMTDDIVSVISVDNTGTAVIPPELQYVKVLAVTLGSGADAEVQQVNQDKKADLPSTVTLLAAPEQAKMLASFEAKGNIQFSLVYRGSEENADKFLKAEDDILNGK